MMSSVKLKCWLYICLPGMIKHFMRMKTRTEWWKLRNFLSGSWNNHVLRFPFMPFLNFNMYICMGNFYVNYIFLTLVFRALYYILSINICIYSVNNNALLVSGQKTSFMLFLNKFDIFEKKILKVRTIQQVYFVIGGVYYHFSFNTLHCAGSA